MSSRRMTAEEYQSKDLFITQKMEEIRIKQDNITESIRRLTNSLEALTKSYQEFNPDRREKLLLSKATLDIRTKMREKQRDYADASREMMSRRRQKDALAMVYFRR